MTEDDALRRDLLWRIESRRASVQAFLRANRPRIRRRATLAAVLSSLAALFTAGPAFGGEKFSTGVQNAFGLVSDSYVWRVLCLLALLVSVASAVLTNLGKTQDDAGRLSSAEAAGAELEGLTSLLQYGQLTVQDGVKLYQQYSVKIPFIDDLAAAGPGQQGPYSQGQYPQGPFQPGPNGPSHGYYQPSGPAQGYPTPPPQAPGPYPPQPPQG